MPLPIRKPESHLPPEVRVLAHEQSLDALLNLIGLMNTAKSEKVRLAAACVLLQHADRSPAKKEPSLIEFFSQIPLDEPAEAPTEQPAQQTGEDA